MNKKLYKLHYKDTKNNILIEDAIESESCLDALQKGLLFSKRYGLILLKVELMFSYRDKPKKERTLFQYAKT